MGKRGNGEGSIYQDARGLWRAIVTLEGGKRKYLSGRTRQEVAKKLSAALRDVDYGLPLPGERLTLDKYLADWLANTIKPGRRAGDWQGDTREGRPTARPEDASGSAGERLGCEAHQTHTGVSVGCAGPSRSVGSAHPQPRAARGAATRRRRGTAATNAAPGSGTPGRCARP